MPAARCRLVLRIVVPLVLWGLITHGTYAGSGDEPHYLAIAHSLAFDGDLDLANNYGAAEPLVGGGVLAPGNHVRPRPDGTLRPVHDVGLPILFAPVVRLLVPAVSWIVAHVPERVLQRARLTPAVLYRQTLSLVTIALATLLAGVIFNTLVDGGAIPRQALGWALVVMLSPPLLLFSVLFFTELPSALVCLIAFRRIRSGASGTGPWLVTGALAGLLLLLHARNLGLVLALAGIAAFELWRRRDMHALAGFAAGAAGLFAVRTAINHRLWGTWLTNPHAGLGPWEGAGAFAAEMLRRTAGLLIDQEYGLLIYAPVYVLVGIGWLALRRENASLAYATLFVIAGYVGLIVCPITNIHGVAGGWSPPARFLTPIVPLLAPPLFAGARRVPRPLLALLLVLQIAIDATLWQIPKLAWNDGDGRAAFCERLGEGVCRVLPSVEAQ